MKTFSLRVAGIIVALAAAVGLAGCTAIKLGYNSFPNLAYHWLDGYIDFSDDQSPLARDEISRLHGWHRQQELPRLAELLQRLEQMAPASISPQQACSVVGEVQGRLNQLAERAEPAVAALAVGFDSDQLRHLERKYRRNNDKYRKEWIRSGPAQHKEKRFEQMLDRLEWIYGSLDEPQRAVLRQGIEQSQFDPQRQLAERQRRQQDLLQVLGRLAEPGVAADAARAQLRGYFQRVQRSPDPGHRALQEALLQENCRMFSAVHESTTPSQREQAVRRLRGYQRDLRDLSGQL